MAWWIEKFDLSGRHTRQRCTESRRYWRGLRTRLADATASRDVRDVQGAVMTAIQTF